jgi:hypothetical protein
VLLASARTDRCCSWRGLSVARWIRRYMDKLWFDDADYSFVVKNRGSPPDPWKWEIYRAGRSSPIGQSPTFFFTMAAATKAGRAALKQLLARLNA